MDGIKRTGFSNGFTSPNEAEEFAREKTKADWWEIEPYMDFDTGEIRYWLTTVYLN